MMEISDLREAPAHCKHLTVSQGDGVWPWKGVRVLEMDELRSTKGMDFGLKPAVIKEIESISSPTPESHAQATACVV